MNPNRVIGGMKAESGGRSFEDALSVAHRAYLDHGLAHVVQLPVPTRPCGGGHRVLVERQGFDFFGVFGPNAGPDGELGAYHGRMIAMEAKYTRETKASLPIMEAKKKGWGLKEHQLNALADVYEDFGVVAVVVWRNGQDGLVLLPPAVLEARRAMARGSWRIPRAAFVPYDVVDYPRHRAVEDWLFAARDWMGGAAPSPALSRRKVYHMLRYRINFKERTVSVLDPETGAVIRTVPAPVPDRQTFDRLACECADADAFCKRVQELTIDHG